MDILDVREEFGIQTPDTTPDEVVKVSAPDVERMSLLNNKTPIIAWESFDYEPTCNETDQDDDWYNVAPPSPCPPLNNVHDEGGAYRKAIDLFGS